MLLNLSCKLGMHKKIPKYRSYESFTSVDKDGRITKFWQAHFLYCESCGKRFFETNYPKYLSHDGVDAQKHIWLDSGIVSKGIYSLEEMHRNIGDYYDPWNRKPAKPKANDIGETVLKLLRKALSTESEDEAIACLKQARKHSNV